MMVRDEWRALQMTASCKSGVSSELSKEMDTVVFFCAGKGEKTGISVESERRTERTEAVL